MFVVYDIVFVLGFLLTNFSPPTPITISIGLQFNPQKRITCEEALAHPFVAEFHVPAEEISCSGVISISIDDNHKYSIADYRAQLYEDIVNKKKEQRRARKAKKLKRESERRKKGEKKGERREKGEKRERSKEKGERSGERKEKKKTKKKVEE